MKQIFVALVAIALTVAPVASAETIANTGNGVDSNNVATINNNNSTSVSQSNVATINNSIAVSSNTGDNSASRNTGGDVKVNTGDSGVKVGIENFANQNSAKVDDCCKVGGNTSVANSGNGDSSYNDATLNATKSTVLGQTNYANIANAVEVQSNTGGNEADKNTGNGFNSGVSVTTGDSLVGPIKITNNANSNVAQVGSAMGSAGVGSVTLGNGGNGVDSDNAAVANLNNSTYVAQSNGADILNWVGVSSNTGDNSSNSNTGGDVKIDTGDSAIAVGLSTNVNSNAAWVNNCGCVALGDTVVKNIGNGDSANSDATLNNSNESATAQVNYSDVANTGSFESVTGWNQADSNTGAAYGWSDPSINTGVGYTNVNASTSANQNMLNSGVVAMPTLPPTTGAGNGYWWSWGYGMNMSY